MAFDMLEALTLIAREKSIELDTVIEALESSLLVAAQKKYSQTENLSFKFDRKNNELLMIATKRVIAEVADPDQEISLESAREIDASAEVGDELDLYLDYEAEFGRNAIASAKQILVQKIRDIEHERIYDEFIDKVGTLVSGVVQQIDKGNVIVKLGRGEAILPGKEQIPREKFRQGDRVRAYILDVQNTPRGPQIVLSRNNEEFLRQLFALEVPEIYERVIEIKRIAREPGERAKVAVYSSDDRIDPVGACVGIKGVRVQSIVRELNNERIDIVPYSTHSEMFVTRSLAPAKVVHIDVFEMEDKMTVVVEDDKLSLAIGRNGQNARLASKLTGWKINILSESEYNEARKREAEILEPVGMLEGIGDKIRDRLVEHDISSVQRLAAATPETLTKINGIGPKTAEKLIERALARVEVLEAEKDEREAGLAEEMSTTGAEGVLSESDVFIDDDGPEIEEDVADESEVESDKENDADVDNAAPEETEETEAEEVDEEIEPKSEEAEDKNE